MTPSRRTFLTGLSASLIAAPAVVRFASLMQVRGLVMGVPLPLVTNYDIYADMAEVTRKAFVPRLFVQLYTSVPLAEALERNRN